ncbi:hypothetical protein KIPB_002097, partial [Kipferlia bialata]
IMFGLLVLAGGWWLMVHVLMVLGIIVMCLFPVPIVYGIMVFRSVNNAPDSKKSQKTKKEEYLAHMRAVNAAKAAEQTAEDAV